MGKRQLPPEEPAEIHEVMLRDALEERYLAYALSTIMHRALPDARDGLKPVHRRILYGMRLLRLDPGTPFKKSAKIVGDVMGSFHPHGDQSIYDALVRLAQDFSSRYPLVDGQGNFGNIDGDNAAAYRYTEAKLTPVAMALMAGIDDNAGAHTGQCGPGVQEAVPQPGESHAQRGVHEREYRFAVECRQVVPELFKDPPHRTALFGEPLQCGTEQFLHAHLGPFLCRLLQCFVGGGPLVTQVDEG